MTALWPLEKLDVAALRRSGLRAVPFRQFVLKVNGRCNLACSYCYVYEGADSSWRDRPNRVSPPSYNAPRPGSPSTPRPTN